MTHSLLISVSSFWPTCYYNEYHSVMVRVRQDREAGDVGNQRAKTESREATDNNGSPLRKGKESGGLCYQTSL